MTFAEATRYCFSHLTDFQGRGRRAEFWWYYLALRILSMVAMAVMMIIFFVVMAGMLTAASAASTSDTSAATAVGGIIGVGIWYVVFFLILLAENLLFVAAEVRRLHDVGQSGQWMWLYLAGLGLVPLIMCIQDGQPYPNQWGPDPKAAERAAMLQYWAPGYAAPGYAAPGYAAPQYAAPPAPSALPAPPAPPAPPAV